MEFYKLFYKFLEKEKQKKVWGDESGYVNACSFRHGYITERLTADRVRRWNAHTPVLVSAQTGAGKTTFVLKVLLPVMKERGKRLVILCSRKVLAQQIRRAAARLEMPDSPDELIEAYIKYRRNFGAVDVYTYQEVALRFQNDQFVRSFQYYGAVVCDECHFFIQDAQFNMFTERIFQMIQKYASKSVRVYLTATPEPVADLIADSEYNNKSGLARYVRFREDMLKPQFLFYTFERDYEYVNPFFFQDWNTIVDEINKHQTEEKWLIFVSRKEEGKKLEELLGAKRALFVDAESKNGDKAEDIEKIVVMSQFDKNILIVTKFLDVGVNLWDPQLKNVVLSTLDKTEFTQALGRKRIKSGECVNTYIRVPYMEEIIKRKQVSCLQLNQLYEYLQELKQNGMLVNKVLFPFYFEKKDNNWLVEYNKFTPIAYKQQKEAMDEFCEDIESEAKEVIAQKFLVWLGIEHKYQPERWLGDATDKDLEDVLLPWTGRDLSDGHYDEFCHVITDYVKTHSPDEAGSHSERVMGTKRIRDFLSKAGIIYTIKNPAKGIHRIERG